MRINDNPTQLNDGNYFWAFGYWKYFKERDSFGWVEGTWQPFDPDWVLVPGCYYWRPEGYFFVPPYWDYPISNRGTLYSCTYPVGKISIETVLQNCFAFYPDYLSWYQHWWHFNKGEKETCWCFPPWWNWREWWSFAWQDQWILWWWYTHPGFLQPSWMTKELSEQIVPPSEKLVNFMKSIPAPEFIKNFPQRGNNPLVPTGKVKIKNLPRP